MCWLAVGVRAMAGLLTHAAPGKGQNRAQCLLETRFLVAVYGSSYVSILGCVTLGNATYSKTQAKAGFV